jgi:hypothetical protein
MRTLRLEVHRDRMDLQAIIEGLEARVDKAETREQTCKH